MLKIQGATLCMADLDEMLFPIAGLLNFTADVTELAGVDQLHLSLQVCAGEGERVAEAVTAAVRNSGLLTPLFRMGTLAIGGITFNSAGWFTTGTGKRYIKDCRQRHING